MNVFAFSRSGKYPYPVYTLTATCVALLVSVVMMIGRSFHSGSGVASVAPADTAAYSLGYEHATALLRENLPEEDFLVRLLDTRARQQIIATRFGSSAAQAYESGFEDAVRTESPDSLAPLLLGR